MVPSLLVSLWLLGPVGGERREVVVTTDVGASIDDQWALIHLASSCRVNLRGIVTSHSPNLAPPAAESSAAAAREAIAKLPSGRRPAIVSGSSSPMPAADRPRRGAGVDFLLRASRDHRPEDRLVVVVIGPATDVASAIVIDPSFVDRVELIAMAFDHWPEGGDAWNVEHDPVAWKVIFSSDIPLTVGDAVVTERHLTLTRRELEELKPRLGDVGGYLAGLVRDQLDADPELARRLTGSADAWPVWDEVATAVVLGMVETEGHPRPSLDEDLTLNHDHPDRHAQVRWVTRIDAPRLWADFARSIRNLRSADPMDLGR